MVGSNSGSTQQSAGKQGLGDGIGCAVSDFGTGRFDSATGGVPWHDGGSGMYLSLEVSICRSDPPCTTERRYHTALASGEAIIVSPNDACEAATVPTKHGFGVENMQSQVTSRGRLGDRK
jgi:hypothetical protein